MILEPPKKWIDDNAIYLLLDKWKSHEQDFKQGRLRHEVIWRTISDELKESGYEYNGYQCENKFKDLRKNYMKVKDHNEQTGAEPKFWKYFNRMDELFGDKPNVKPVCLASNRRKRVQNNFLSDGDSSADESKEKFEKKKKLKLTKGEKLMKSLTDFWSQEAIKRREDANRMHIEMCEANQANRAMMKEMLDDNKTFFKQLLDKF